MLSKFFYYLKKTDWLLTITTVLLVCIGLAVLYSISVNQEAPDLSRFNRQLVFAVAGIILMLIFSAIDYRMFNSYRTIFFVVGIVLLLAVLVFGQTIRGSTRWFNFFGQTFQPVEIMKLFLTIYLSGYLALHARNFWQAKHIIISGLLVFGTAALVALEPKVGYAIIFILLWLIILPILKIKTSHLIIVILILAAITAVSWFLVFEEYQKERILTFLDPQRDPLKSGYNVTQSMIAVGSGQILGRGLGLGPQSQLNFLPEQETDFIFSVIAEEMGLIGVTVILVIYALLFYRMWLAARETRDNFALFFIVITFILFFIQIFVNVGMNIGLLPVTGIPLPLLSAGGSSLIITLVSLGIIQSIIARSKA